MYNVLVIVVPTEAYPLQWPEGVQRCRFPRASAFGFHAVGDRIKRVRAQLKLLGGVRTIVISSNVPLRQDGLPMASAATTRPEGDAGVAVYWTRNERRNGREMLMPYCMPCDRWQRLADNLHAIALTIEAMRGMDRWGATTVEQAFAGFAALPPGSGEENIPQQPDIDWRIVLGGAWPPDLTGEELFAIARARHRKAMELAHPDAGGSNEAAVQLNLAIAAAERELRS